MRDLDCPGQGYCCFDGCAATCLAGSQKPHKVRNEQVAKYNLDKVIAPKHVSLPAIMKPVKKPVIAYPKPAPLKEYPKPLPPPATTPRPPKIHHVPKVVLHSETHSDLLSPVLSIPASALAILPIRLSDLPL